MADEKSITIVVAEMIGGKTFIFGMETDPATQLKGMTEVIDPQFLTRREAFQCPFCKKALIGLSQSRCQECDVDFTTPESQAALRNVQVEQIYGVRLWSRQHDLKPGVRINADNIVAWSTVEDWSETRMAWQKEREDAERRASEARAERAGVEIATEAQAAALVKNKIKTDAMLKGKPSDGAAPFEIVR